MKILIFITLLLSSITANSTSVSFTGNLVNDDDVQLFNFTIDSESDVTLRTLSYAGGVNVNGELISSGGFDPILALFDGTGNFLDRNDDGSNVTSDPATENAFDALLNVTLGAGDYIVAVMQYSNRTVGTTLADGFGSSGQIGFGGRTSFWAVDFSDTDTVSAVPVPNAIWFMGTGLFGLFGMRRKSLKTS